MDTATVKTIAKFYKTTLPSDIIFAKVYAYTSDEKVDNLTSEFNIHYRAFIISLICLLSKGVDISFSVHKLSGFSSKHGKVHFKGLVHLLIYIMDNNTLGLKYYYYMKDAPLSDLLRQTSINTDKQFMAFCDYICQNCPDTSRITLAYIIFYQSGPIDLGTYVPVPVAQSGAES